MRTTKRIIIRIIVAVAVTIILSKLKLLNIINVSALETYQYQANDFCVWQGGSATSNQACDTNLSTLTIFGRTFKSYQYERYTSSGLSLPTVSFGFPSSQIQNKHVNLAFVLYIGGVETDEGSFPVRAYFVNNGDTISCNVEGSYDYGISSKIYTVNCPHYIQYGTASRVFINGNFYIPDSSAFGVFSISNISAIYDNDELVAQQQANNYLQQILSSLQSNNQTMQDIKNNTKETNDLIKSDDTTESNSKGKEFFDDFESNSHGLSGIITAPLRLLNSLTTASCRPLEFDLPFDLGHVSLPCMRGIYEEHFGIFFSLWQLITTGLISYNVCLNLYSKVRAMQNPHNDRIEVLNL